MSSQPYLRVVDDGTYELLVPSRGSVHILPYCFHTEEDAARWLATRKGREHIEQIQNMKNREREGRRYATSSAASSVLRALSP